MHDPYTRLQRREHYRNRWLTVESHEIVHPNGEPGEHVLIVGQPPSGVVVLDGETVVLTRQPRFAARCEVLEVVKGGAEAGESAQACAVRELREELGFEAEHWLPLGSIYELPSLMQDPVTLFLARDLVHCERNLEATEQITGVRMPFREAIDGAMRGDFADAVTVAAILRAAAALGIISV